MKDKDIAIFNVFFVNINIVGVDHISNLLLMLFMVLLMLMSAFYVICFFDNQVCMAQTVYGQSSWSMWGASKRQTRFFSSSSFVIARVWFVELFLEIWKIAKGWRVLSSYEIDWCNAIEIRIFVMMEIQSFSESEDFIWDLKSGRQPSKREWQLMQF